MRIIKTSLPNLPSGALAYTPSENEKTMLAGGIGLLLEPNFVTLKNGVFTAWVDRVTGRRYIPARAEPPQYIADGTSHALRFGFGGAGVSVGTNGVLKPEGGFNLLDPSGKHSFVILLRQPIPAAEGGTEVDAQAGGTFFGSPVATEYFQLSASYGTGNLLAHNRKDMTAFTYAGGWDDALWRMIVISIDPVAGTNNIVVRVNGTQVYASSAALPALSTLANARQLVIGGAGVAYDTSRYTGEIGGVGYFPGLAIHQNPASLAATEAHFGTIRNALAA